jgi:hypothetical protein
VVDGDVVVTEAFPHSHARHGMQTTVRSPFPDVARCCEAQAAAVPHVVSTTSNCRGRLDAVVRLWVVVVSRSEYQFFSTSKMSSTLRRNLVCSCPIKDYKGLRLDANELWLHLSKKTSIAAINITLGVPGRRADKIFQKKNERRRY